MGSSGVATLMVIMATMMRRASRMFLLVVVVAVLPTSVRNLLWGDRADI